MAKNILKEAIADAKAVREVALANAKAALEEAFTPRLQSMLSAKLSEELDEGEDKEEIEETYMEDKEEMDESYMEGEKEDLDEEIDLEEILNELELEEGEDSKEETVEEAKDKDEETMDEAKGDEEEMEEAVGYPNHRADNMKKVHHQADDMNQGLKEGEDFDLDTLLEEINNLDETEDEVNEEVEDIKEFDRYGGKKAADTSQSDSLRAMASSASSYEDWQAKATEAGAHPNIINSDRWKAYVEKQITAESMYEALETELAETQAALEVKTTELNEVNLLNSKLLYVNRIFKANTLDEGQKLRVVETLDKADSIKEAKLIYETIKDTFNVAKSKKASVKSKTKSIKEGLGMASKAAGMSTAKKEVISESNNMINRFQKLANIKINQ